MDNNRAKWQSELRRKLEREAFNEKYKCFICGRKDNLHIHHLVYSNIKEEFFDPSSYVILCKYCHGKVPRGTKVITGIERGYQGNLSTCENCEHMFPQECFHEVIIDSKKMIICHKCLKKALNDKVITSEEQIK